MEKLVQHSTFGARLLGLPNIFEDRFFTIPDYQRGYAWEEKQVRELLTDIEHVLRDNAQLRHYTGTLVFSCSPDVSETEFDVVDGQQRLTTLVILMQALYAYLSGGDGERLKKLYIERGRYGSERYVLRMNMESRQFFENRVMRGERTTRPTMESHGRLLKAQQICEGWLKRIHAAGVEAQDVRHAMESELGFLVYAPRDTAETGIMFEVINNRGKPLSELEKVKNYLIYCCAKLSAPSTRKWVDDGWAQILADLNTARKTRPAEEAAFLRYCMAVKFRLNKTDSQYGYDELKKHLDIGQASNSDSRSKSAIETVRSFVDFLKAAAGWYAILYGRRYRGLDYNLRDVMSRIRAQERHATIMPLVLALLIKLKPSSSRLVTILNLVEILNFRVYMARHIVARNDSGQAELFRLAHQYFHGDLYRMSVGEQWDIGDESIDSGEDALETCLVEFVCDSAEERLFEKSFQLEQGSAEDIYKWRGLKYFLMNYEAYLNPHKTIDIDKITRSRDEGKTADYLSIEHIWATGYRAGAGENDRKRDSRERRRLGNFVLLELRLNIQGSDQAIRRKCRRYVDGEGNEPPSEMQQVRKMAKDARASLAKHRNRNRSKNYYLEMYRDINDRQERRYIQFALQRWSVSGFLGYQALIEEETD
jgi:hypothetical protein